MQPHTVLQFSQKLLNKSAMHAVISLLLQNRKFWWYILMTSSMLLHDVIMTSYCCQRYAKCLVMTLFQQDSPPPHHARATVELLRQETPNFLASNRGLQTAQISVLWITRYGLSCSIVSTTDKSIVWTRLLTSGEEDFKRVSVPKEDILSAACELTMLILSISV